MALAGVTQWISGLSAGLRTKGLLVRFPVRARAWVSGKVPSRRHMRDNHTLMFLSLYFSLPSPVFIKKERKTERKKSLRKKKRKIDLLVIVRAMVALGYKILV